MKKQPRLGRPPMKKRDRRSVMVPVRMTKQEYACIANAAKAKGETVSAWIRASLIATVDMEIELELMGLK